MGSSRSWEMPLRGGGTDSQASLLDGYRGLQHACSGYCVTAKGVCEAHVVCEATLGGHAAVPQKCVEAVEAMVRNEKELNTQVAVVPGLSYRVHVLVRRGAFFACAAAEDFSMAITNKFIEDVAQKFQEMYRGNTIGNLSRDDVDEFSQLLSDEAERWSK